MTRQEYIAAVKVKLDEISPFDEPSGFIAAGGDSDYNKVKPVVSYIESELDNAATFCLNTLPLSLLAESIDTDTANVRVDSKGVGRIADMYEYLRLVRVSCSAFDRDITAFITTASPLYLLQQNKYTRGGAAKPVAAYNPEQATIELFSFSTANISNVRAEIYYIDSRTKAERITSHIEDFIVLACAIRVLRILGDDAAVTRLTNEFNEAVATIQA